jgi:hypothetical protein
MHANKHESVIQSFDSGFRVIRGTLFFARPIKI